TTKVHFDATARPDGRRLVYGGHVMRLGRALSCNRLCNAQLSVAINAGAHASAWYAGDSESARSEVHVKAETAAPDIGALRLRLVAIRAGGGDGLKDEDG